MSKIKVRTIDIENYTHTTRALDNKYGRDGWRWAPWAFEAGPGGDVLSWPSSQQDVIIPKTGVITAADAIA